MMKKVTLLLPDEMMHTRGPASRSVQSKVGTTAETIVKAICGNDYHINYYVENESEIEVLSVEEV